jgi:uncharacterized membrane protein SpoIIM required for sporulation
MLDFKKDVVPTLLIFAGAALVGACIGYIGGYSLITPVRTFISGSATGIVVNAAAQHSRLAEATAIFANNVIYTAAIGVGVLAFKHYGSQFLHLITAYTGGMFGVVVGLGVAVLGVQLTAAAILPHGVLELPTVLIGLCIGHYGLRLARDGTPHKEAALTSAKMLLVMCVPALLLAAAIETYVTPTIMAMVV